MSGRRAQRPVTSGYRFGESVPGIRNTLRGIGYRNSFAAGVGSWSGGAPGGRFLVRRTTHRMPATSTALEGAAE